MTKTPWTDDEVARLAAMAKTYSLVQAARKLGRTCDSVMSKVKTEGISFSKWSSLPDASKERPVKPIKESERLSAARAENTALKAENERLRLQFGKEQLITDRIAAAVQVLSPAPKYKSLRTKRCKHTVIAVACLGDWHIGEVIRKEETVGFGTYDFETAKLRAAKFVANFSEWVDVQRQGYRIDDLVVPILGDMVSGEIHYELSLTNEFPMPVASALCGRLLAEKLRDLSGQFRSVSVWAVSPDNHGRPKDFARPPTKRAAERNWNYVVYTIAEAHLRGMKNLMFNRPPAIRFPMQVGQFTFLVEHGNAVRGWMGRPYYGWARQKGREAIRHMARGERFDYQLVGHWHEPFLLEDTIGNGCLAGSSELDAASSRFAPPSQLGFLVSQHGAFGYVPFRLEGEHDGGSPGGIAPSDGG